MLSDRSTPSLAAEDLTIDRGGVRVLNQVSFTAGPGCLMGVVGPQWRRQEHAVRRYCLSAASHQRTDTDSRQAHRRSARLVAYVPQYEQVNWRLPMSALDVTLLGRTRRIGWFQRPGRTDRAAAEDALTQVGLWEQRHSLVTELSGGQRQRVFVARALAQGADVLLLDEAFSGVDIASQEALVSVLMKLRDEGRTILLSSHDINHLAHYCDECLCLNCHVCACGAPQEVLTEDVLTELYGPFGSVPSHGHGLAGDAHGHHH